MKCLVLVASLNLLFTFPSNATYSSGSPIKNTFTTQGSTTLTSPTGTKTNLVVASPTTTKGTPSTTTITTQGTTSPHTPSSLNSTAKTQQTTTSDTTLSIATTLPGTSKPDSAAKTTPSTTTLPGTSKPDSAAKTTPSTTTLPGTSKPDSAAKTTLSKTTLPESTTTLRTPEITESVTTTTMPSVTTITTPLNSTTSTPSKTTSITVGKTTTMPSTSTSLTSPRTGITSSTTSGKISTQTGTTTPGISSSTKSGTTTSTTQTGTSLTTIPGTSSSTTSGTTTSTQTGTSSLTPVTPTTTPLDSFTSISPAIPLTTVTSGRSTIVQTPGRTATMTEKTSRHITTTQEKPTTPRTVTPGVLNYTRVPTEAPVFGEGSIFQLQIVLILVNISEFSGDVELILKEKLHQMVFIGYNEAVKNISFSSSNSKRYLKSTRRNILNRDGSATNTQSQIKNISITIQISVNSLRNLHTTIEQFVSSISNNLLHNITKITNSSWSALNTTDEITRQLVLQSKDMSECNATGRLCIPGYECRPSPENYYTGICYHMCDLQIELCKNRGHCYFDAIKKHTACSCTTTWLTVYHGADCTEQTGQMAYVIGVPVGLVVLFIALIVVIAIIRRWKRHDHQSKLGYGAYDDRSGLRSDFLTQPNGVEVVDFNYRKSTKLNYSVNEEGSSNVMKYAETDSRSPSTPKDQRTAVDSRSQDFIKASPLVHKAIPESKVFNATATTLQETKHDIKSSQMSVITKTVPNESSKDHTDQEISGPFSPKNADTKKQKSFLFGSKSSY